MCVGVWTLDHPEYALILSTNRDEYLSRPTTDAEFHSFGRDTTGNGKVLSGRDVRAGGTWLGINRAGKFGLLTNITEPPGVFSVSRGSLISSFLMSKSSGPLEEEVSKIIPRDEARYAGFNMLLLAPLNRPRQSLSFDASFVTNNGAGGYVSSRPLSEDERRCGAISNGIDGKGGNTWPKVQQILRSFQVILQTLSPGHAEADLTERLFDLLSWQSAECVRERSQLRNTVHVEPIPIPITVDESKGPDLYGTRLSTVLLIRKDGHVLFIERDAWLIVDGKATKGDPRRDRVFRFQLEI